MDVQKVAISKINPAPYNPRKDLKPDDLDYKRLLKSIEEFGCVEPLVWNKRSGVLVGGHQRFKILLARGASRVDVSVVDLPPEKEKALNIALNKISGDWDKGKLGKLLEELTSIPDFDVEVTGFDLPDVEELLSGLVEDCELSPESFDVEKELARDEPTVTQPGDLIELGPHRMLCGDATKSDDLARLMGDRRARMLFADPPYNVNYSGENRPKPKGSKAKKEEGKTAWDKIPSDHLPPARYAAWFKAFINTVSDFLLPGGAFYIWNGHGNFGLMHETVRKAKLRPATVLTWAKESFSLGFGDYNEQTEFCLYGWKTGAKRKWYGPNNESTLWGIRRDPTKTYRHPTQKALGLAERAVSNSSRAGDLILDPFLGSGTTLIAAARLGRHCTGLEIEPRYCDVIVRRFLALAGPSAVTQAVAERYSIASRPEVPA